MPNYTARLSHHSISHAEIHALAATTEAAAKREARRLLGDGFEGHMIYLEERIDYVRLPVACATVGRPGWTPLP